MNIVYLDQDLLQTAWKDGEFSIPNYKEFATPLSTVFKAIRSFSPEAAEKPCKILADYLGRFGFEGAYMRMNNRTVERIFAEYTSGMKPLASGQLDGVEYDLYEARDGDAAGDK